MTCLSPLISRPSQMPVSGFMMPAVQVGSLRHMGDGEQCSEELTPPRSLGYLEVECALNWPAGCPHCNPPPPLSRLPEGESGSCRPICSRLHPLLTSSACQPLADLSKPVTACSFLSG